MDRWEFWLLGSIGLVVFVVAVPYVLGPLLIFFTLRFRLPPTIIPVNPREEPLPDDARTYFSDAYGALTAESFELVGTIGLPNLLPNAQTLFALYANRSTCDVAMSAIIVAQGGMGPELRNNYVEFVRQYDDGVVVQTNNSRELSAFKRLPNEFTTKFWNIKDIRKLFRIHLLSCEHCRQRGQPVLRLDSEFGGDAVRYVAQAVLEETFREQVGVGYLAETGAGFRPSVFGAVIMTWQELWPAKALRRAAEKRRADALLAELKRQAKGGP